MPNGRLLLTAVVAWASLFLVLAAWALASPVGSGPDESNHHAKAAATVRGQFVGEPTGDQGVTTVRVPVDVADPQGPTPCFRFDPDASADCAPPFADRDGTVEVRTGVGSYDPVYYLLVGWPTLLADGEQAYLGVRLVSAALVAALFSVVLVVAAALRRDRALPAAAAVALTPMALYLGGLVNPNSVEVAACAALAAVAWLLVHDGDGRRRGRWLTLLVACGVLAGTMRTTSPLLVLLVVLGVLLTDPPASVRLLRTRPALVALGAAVVLLVPAAAWTLLVAGPAGYIPSSPERLGPVEAALRTVGLLPEYGIQMVGILGWFDTHLPPVVLAGWVLAAGAVLVAGLGTSRRHRPGVVLLLAACVLLPVLVQAAGAGEYGIIWQGRYGLPLACATVLVAGLVAGSDVVRPPAVRRLTVVLWSAAVLGHAAAFATAYRRYSVGEGRPASLVLEGAGWQAPGGPVLVSVAFVVGLLGTATLAVSLSRRPLGPTNIRQVSGEGPTSTKGDA